MPNRSVLSLCSLLLVACGSGADPRSAGDGGTSQQRGDGGLRDGGSPGAGPSDASSGTTDARVDSGDASVLPDASSVPDATLAACTNDAREPDDHLADAERHDPVSGIVPIELTGLVACPFDRDVVWAGRVDSGGKAGAELTWDASLGDLELSLGDADNMPITQTDVSTSQPGHAEERVDEYYDSYFYVRVRNPGNVSIPYTLIVTAQVFGP